MNHLITITNVIILVLPLLLALFAYVRSDKRLPKQTMTFTLLNIFLIFLYNYLHTQRLFSGLTFLHTLYLGAALWILPSIYLYINAHILDEKRFRRELIHLLPGIAFCIMQFLIVSDRSGEMEGILFMNACGIGSMLAIPGPMPGFVFEVEFTILSVAQAIYYIFFLIRLPEPHKQTLHLAFADIKRRPVDKLPCIYLSLALPGITLINLYGLLTAENKPALFLVTFISLFSVIFWGTCILSLYLQSPQEITRDMICEPEPIPEIFDDRDALLIRKLTDYIENRQAFLQSNLSLDIICKELCTNRTYLSGVINKHYRVNFNTYLNQYRVKYIIDFQKRNPRISKQELVQIGGFGSLSSMKRAMKKERDGE